MKYLDGFPAQAHLFINHIYSNIIYFPNPPFLQGLKFINYFSLTLLVT